MRKTGLVWLMFLSVAFSMAPQMRGQSETWTADYPKSQAGVLMKGAQWVGSEWTQLANQNPAKVKAGRGLAASLSYGMVQAKITAEYTGEQAPTRSGTAQPVICICHFQSLPGDPVLVRLHPKKGNRELDGGRMTVYPIVGGSRMADAKSSDLIPADLAHPEPQVWLIRPKMPLEPGEYALMLGTQNMSLFSFSVRAPSIAGAGKK